MNHTIKIFLTKFGYVLGIIFCLVASASLLYVSYLLIGAIISDYSDIADYNYSNLENNDNSNIKNSDNSNVEIKDYSNSADYFYEPYYKPIDIYSETYTDTIEENIVIFQELGFENYVGLVEISYDLNTLLDGDPNGLEIYFIKSVAEYDRFTSGINAQVQDYKSCQKKDVMITSGQCTIKNGGGLMLYNASNTPRIITMTYTVKSGSSLIESK